MQLLKKAELGQQIAPPKLSLNLFRDSAVQHKEVKLMTGLL